MGGCSSKPATAERECRNRELNPLYGSLEATDLSNSPPYRVSQRSLQSLFIQHHKDGEDSMDEAQTLQELLHEPKTLLDSGVTDAGNTDAAAESLQQLREPEPVSPFTEMAAQEDGEECAKMAQVPGLHIASETGRRASFDGRTSPSARNGTPAAANESISLPEAQNSVNSSQTEDIPTFEDNLSSRLSNASVSSCLIENPGPEAGQLHPVSAQATEIVNGLMNMYEEEGETIPKSEKLHYAGEIAVDTKSEEKADKDDCISKSEKINYAGKIAADTKSEEKADKDDCITISEEKVDKDDCVAKSEEKAEKDDCTTKSEEKADVSKTGEGASAKDENYFEVGVQTGILRGDGEEGLQAEEKAGIQAERTNQEEAMCVKENVNGDAPWCIQSAEKQNLRDSEKADDYSHTEKKSATDAFPPHVDSAVPECKADEPAFAEDLEQISCTPDDALKKMLAVETNITHDPEQPESAMELANDSNVMSVDGNCKQQENHFNLLLDSQSDSNHDSNQTTESAASIHDGRSDKSQTADSAASIDDGHDENLRNDHDHTTQTCVKASQF